MRNVKQNDTVDFSPELTRKFEKAAARTRKGLPKPPDGKPRHVTISTSDIVIEALQPGSDNLLVSALERIGVKPEALLASINNIIDECEDLTFKARHDKLKGNNRAT